MNIYEKIFSETGLSASQNAILDIVGSGKKVLEIGSSSGYMTEVMQSRDCKVVVVEKDKEAVKQAAKFAVKVIENSIEDEQVLKQVGKDFDFIVMADVLEHLVDPEATLNRLRAISDNKTKLIISMPNVACWVMRKQLFFKGDFEYQDSGLLDKTHLHFYSTKTLPKLLEKNYWQVQQVLGTITRIPLEESLGKIPLFGQIFSEYIKKKIVKKYPNLAYYHFVVVATL